MYERIKHKKRGYTVKTTEPNPTKEDPKAVTTVVRHVESLYKANRLKPKVEK